MRGYCGIGVQNLKSTPNYGGVFRAAYNFNADFIFLIGKRFRKQPSDTLHTTRHMPLFEYRSAEDFVCHIPYGCILVGVEIAGNARDISGFSHPERAIYVLGPEDGSISPVLLQHCRAVIQIPSNRCLNVATAAGIVLYDRLLKAEQSPSNTKLEEARA